MLDTALIDHILTTIPGKTIGLVGDLFLDRYLDIDTALNEPSIETGLTAYQVTRVRNYPGALGTVLNNLIALGVGTLEPLTVIGDDGEGYELLQVLSRSPAVCLDGVIKGKDRCTPTYTKPMLNESAGVREWNRFDIKNRQHLPQPLEEQLAARIIAGWPRWDALLVLDQVSERNCGVITDHIRELIEGLAQEDPAKFVLADSRERIAEFEVVSVKPNATEAARLPHRSNQRRFITRGEEGLELWEPGAGAIRLPAYPVAGPIDICGAGDSCSAGIAAAMVCGASTAQAAAFGNLIASITIQQIGVTGTATPTQVRDRWQQL